MSQVFLIVDDHESVLAGTCSVLQGQYPEANIITASTTSEVSALAEETNPELIVMDLSIPKEPEGQPRTDNGIELLQTLLSEYPSLNFVVQSAHAKALIRLKPVIDGHRGGFTIAEKSLPSHEMLIKVDWSLKGLLYTPADMRTGLEIKPEWLKLLQLAFNDGLTDKAVAQKMNVSERTVRHYWTRVQDALGVYPDSGVNIRIQTYNEARQSGLLD
ncbi:MAG: response regulator transcription factor [Cyanobacteria bacterium P01_D01_bin.105]